MNPLVKKTLRQSLRINKHAVSVANNAYDRLFRSDTLIKSDLTRKQEIHSNGLMTVHYYPPLQESQIELNDGSSLAVEKIAQTIPLVIVPPLAASSLIFDLLPHRSLVKYFLAKGFPVYLVDWGEPKREHTHLGIKDYVEDMLPDAIQHIRKHSGQQQLSLMGWCMGGLFSLMYTALSQDKHIKNIITIASPIDSRQGGVGGGMIAALLGPAKLIRKYTGFRINRLDPKYFRVPGKINSIAFKLTNPIGSLSTYWDLLVNIWDRDFLESHTTTSDFLDNMHDYPGGIMQDFTVKFALNNQLSKGQMKVGGKTVNFEKIHCSLLAVAGDTDALVTPAAARKSMELVSSGDKEFIIAPGGHAGVVMGAKAQSHVWAVAADWLGTRSH